MFKLLVLLLSAASFFGAEAPWAKVRALKSGVELRIYKRGAKQPVLAKMDEATEENLIVVLKNEQVAIPKDEIDRIDSRPAQSGARVAKETKTTTEPPDAKSPPVGPRGSSGPSTSTSTSLSIGSRPDFEAVYRRTPAPAQKTGN